MKSFDPDFRRTKQGSKCVIWFCCHCFKKIKDISKAIPVTVDWNNHWYVTGHDKKAEFPLQHSEIHNEYFGATCFKKMEKENVKTN